MKLVKIRFTSWRDQGPARAGALQDQIEAWAAREAALSDRAASIGEKLAQSSTLELHQSLVKINNELQEIKDGRTMVFATERAGAEAEMGAASDHKKVGTCGFLVFNDADTEVGKVVDDWGNDLDAEAVYAYEVVDDAPPLPAWARKIER